jgi:hypothetical protein
MISPIELLWGFFDDADSTQCVTPSGRFEAAEADLARALVDQEFDDSFLLLDDHSSTLYSHHNTVYFLARFCPF